jgi:hypothetical protein
MSDRAPEQPKFFCIRLEDRKGDNLDIRLPYNVLKMGVKLSTLFSAKAAKVMADSGIDLTQLTSLPDDQLLALLRDGSISASTSKGDKIRLFCE